ncbi:MAG: guanylate kinase, partial [Pseudomonadota bacterium]
SPSGAGKSTLSRRLLESDPAFALSISATTRPKRPGEEDGKHYYFVEKEEFSRMVAAGEMLEYASVFGNSYGSPRGPVERVLAEGRDMLFDVDWQGAQQIRNSALGAHTLSIFLLPPSITELHRRLVSRAKDSEEVIVRRMSKSWDEISHWDGYDFVLVNDDLNRAEAQLKTIIEATRLRRLQQPGLTDHVRNLQTQFEDLS